MSSPMAMPAMADTQSITMPRKRYQRPSLCMALTSEQNLVKAAVRPEMLEIRGR